MRLVLAMHKGLAERVKRIEAAIRQHDHNFDVVEQLLREIMRDPKYLKREIGFIETKKGKKK